MATALAYGLTEDRATVRDEVLYRVRAFGPDARDLSLLVVNLSARGLMARTGASHAVGERLRVMLPVIGVVVAEIRWSLGGGIGCELERAIGVADYDDMLAVMLKAR